MSDMASNTPFPQFKTTGDDKHDVEVYIEDLIDYCIMQNWFHPSKETEAARKHRYPLPPEQSTNTV